MNNLDGVIRLLNRARGKRTYLLVAVLIGYIIVCDFMEKPLNDRVMGILTALAAATIRAALPSPDKTK